MHFRYIGVFIESWLTLYPHHKYLAFFLKCVSRLHAICKLSFFTFLLFHILLKSLIGFTNPLSFPRTIFIRKQHSRCRRLTLPLDYLFPALQSVQRAELWLVELGLYSSRHHWKKNKAHSKERRSLNSNLTH